jgi:hypothetical protein
MEASNQPSSQQIKKQVSNQATNLLGKILIPK